MNIFIVDDDQQVINTLRLIIKQNFLGDVCGIASNGQEALEEIAHVDADIALVDLLMPVMDGIEFIRAAQLVCPKLRFIMLSYVSAEDLISQAYEAGIEFYIHKPLNSLEVCSVIKRVQRLLQLESTFVRMQSLVRGSVDKAEEPVNSDEDLSSTNIEKLEDVLRRLGLSGDPVCREIAQIASYLHLHRSQCIEPNVSQLCCVFSKSPKALEQRLRRAINMGMVNLANLGIEDYYATTFSELANTLYSFKEVRQEMEYIRGKSQKRGKASVRNFLYALSAMISYNGS